ncbi:MAG: hypothetical protein WKG00_22450 [Polyangiaceae bacterium]
MSSWKKVRNLFWQSGEGGGPAGAGGAPAGGGGGQGDLSDDEFAALLQGSPHAVPAGAPAAAVDAATVTLTAGAGGGMTIDFQEQYDLAGIPDTDEVEQLENFLARLDTALPKASKIAAAQAFLGAIGKDKSNVLEDASRKIGRVRGILQSKEQETQTAIAGEQGQIDSLQAQIEEHRRRMESLNVELEGVRQSCLVEESRLQAARVFFGSVDPK